MKNIYLICIKIVILFLSQFLFAENKNEDWQIIPGISVGKINSTTCENDLINIFGKQNVIQSRIDLYEGEFTSGTILFPVQEEKKLEITWKDTKNRKNPDTIFLRGHHSAWVTKEGISLGTTLKQLEKLNGKPFTLTGWGWDYGGTILDFDGGRLCSLGYCNEVYRGEIKSRRKIILRLTFSVNQDDKEFIVESNKLMGDKNFSSQNTALQKLNPKIWEMVLEFK